MSNLQHLDQQILFGLTVPKGIVGGMKSIQFNARKILAQRAHNRMDMKCFAKSALSNSKRND